MEDILCHLVTENEAALDFVHRRVAGDDVLISVGANVVNFNGYITLNPTASFLWDAMTQPRTASELVGLLTEEFDVSGENAEKDVISFLQMLRHNSMVVAYEDT